MQLSIFQCNIWFGGINLDHLLDHLQKNSYDVLLFQEVYGTQRERKDRRYHLFDILKNEHGFEYIDFAPNFYMVDSILEKSVETDWGTLVASKYPIKHSQNLFYYKTYGRYAYEDLKGDFSQYPHSLQIAEIEVQGKTLSAVTNHGIWGFDDKDNHKRDDMVDFILQHTKDLKNVVLSGDFNVEQHTRAIGNLEKRFTNVFKHTLQTSFNMELEKFHKGNFKNSVVDFIFVSPVVKILEKKVVYENVSDHLGLSCLIEI